MMMFIVAVVLLLHSYGVYLFVRRDSLKAVLIFSDTLHYRVDVCTQDFFDRIFSPQMQ